jgi:hypothetical protein
VEEIETVIGKLLLKNYEENAPSARDVRKTCVMLKAKTVLVDEKFYNNY